MKAVVFGAGNIGRGFLGSLLSKSDFEITFVDVDQGKIELINREREYPVIIVSGFGVSEETVRGIRALSFNDTQGIVDAVVEADVILTAVGKEPLKYVAKCLARGLAARIRRRPGEEIHVVVVACENVQDNTSYLKALLFEEIPEEYQSRINEKVSFPNCVVDRIVPNTAPAGLHLSSLSVAVEEYFQLVIDQNGLKGVPPEIFGMELSPNLDAILEQKLFTLNMAHAITAYYGYLKGVEYIHEAVGEPALKKLLIGALREVEDVLTSRWPTITAEAQENYAAKILKRFENPYLKDEITRVGRQPIRKISSADRLIKPARLLYESGKTPAYLATGITAALRYDYAGDDQAVELVRSIRESGIDYVLAQFSGLSAQSELAKLIRSDFLLTELL